jgi:hypothetical protein
VFRSVQGARLSSTVSQTTGMVILRPTKTVIGRKGSLDAHFGPASEHGHTQEDGFMELNQILKLRSLLFTTFIAIFGAFWFWIVLVSNFPVYTRGWGGNVTLILDALDVMVMPLLGVATISIACMAIVRRSPPLSSVIIILLVVAVLAFSTWSLSPSGQFDLQWRK